MPPLTTTKFGIAIMGLFFWLLTNYLIRHPPVVLSSRHPALDIDSAEEAESAESDFLATAEELAYPRPMSLAWRVAYALTLLGAAGAVITGFAVLYAERKSGQLPFLRAGLVVFDFWFTLHFRRRMNLLYSTSIAAEMPTRDFLRNNIMLVSSLVWASFVYGVFYFLHEPSLHPAVRYGLLGVPASLWGIAAPAFRPEMARSERASA